MSDEEMRSMTYAQLWLQEMGGTVAEHRAGDAPAVRRRPNEVTAAGRAVTHPTRRNT